MSALHRLGSSGGTSTESFAIEQTIDESLRVVSVFISLRHWRLEVICVMGDGGEKRQYARWWQCASVEAIEQGHWPSIELWHQWVQPV